jgi:serine/threonine protein kinase
MEEATSTSGSGAIDPAPALQDSPTQSVTTNTSKKAQTPAQQTPFKWIRGAVIGESTFGQVYLGLNETTGALMAVKQIEINPDAASQEADKTKEGLRILDNEIAIIQRLDHPNVVSYLGHDRTPTATSVFFGYVAGSSISSIVRTYGKLTESLTAYFTRQTLEGLAYLHSNGVVHRNINSDSILLDHNGTVRISGFGEAKVTDDIYAAADVETMPGSVFWMAPECVRSGGGGYSAKADIWAVSCLALEMFSGQRPWGKEEAVSAFYKLGAMNAAPPIPDDVASKITPSALSFLMDCFVMYVKKFFARQYLVCGLVKCMLTFW